MPVQVRARGATASAEVSPSPTSTLSAEEQQAFEEATAVVLAYRQTITDLYSGARTNLNDLNDVATGDLVDQGLTNIQQSRTRAGLRAIESTGPSSCRRPSPSSSISMRRSAHRCASCLYRGSDGGDRAPRMAAARTGAGRAWTTRSSRRRTCLIRVGPLRGCPPERVPSRTNAMLTRRSALVSLCVLWFSSSPELGRRRATGRRAVCERRLRVQAAKWGPLVDVGQVIRQATGACQLETVHLNASRLGFRSEARVHLPGRGRALHL